MKTRIPRKFNPKMLSDCGLFLANMHHRGWGREAQMPFERLLNSQYTKQRQDQIIKKYNEWFKLALRKEVMKSKEFSENEVKVMDILINIQEFVHKVHSAEESQNYSSWVRKILMSISELRKLLKNDINLLETKKKIDQKVAIISKQYEDLV